MDSKAKQDFIRNRVLANEESPDKTCVLWSRHAIAKLVAERLEGSCVERALMSSEVIEE